MQKLISTALIDHARRYLWANPMVDSQAIFKLNRLTRKDGTNRRLDIAGREVLLPTDEEYLAYALSGLPERWLGITKPVPSMRWIKVADAMNSCNALFQFYNSRGKMIPMAFIYLYKQLNGNLVIAIKRDRALPNFDDGFYFRTYSNAVVIDNVREGSNYVGQIFAIKIAKISDISAVSNQRAQWEAKSNVEQTMLFVNGLLRRNFKTTDLKIGDYVDLLWDDTIKAVREVDIDPTRTYESEEDKCVKYIISRGKANGKLDYFDDVDFFLYDRKEDAGLYYHRNTPLSIRQLTHGDYGLPTWSIHAYINYDDNPLKRDTTKMVLYTRDTIGDPQIPNVHSRLTTLYRLPEKEIRKELSSPVGQMEEWRASNLEKDHYNKVMGSMTRELPIEEVALAYGYHGIIEAIGKSLIRPTDNVMPLPPMYRNGGLAICHFDNKVQFTTLVNGMTKLDWGKERPYLVYLINGEVKAKEVVFKYPVRFKPETRGLWYFLDKEADDGDWELVTDESMVKLENDEYAIHADQNRFLLSYRDGSEIIKARLSYKVTSPYVEFSVPSHFWKWRHVDVYLNKRKLIPDLEYRFFKNKIQYIGTGLKENSTVTIDVVAYGLLPEGYDTNMDYEVGFVTNHCVSYGNGRYLLTDRDPLINVAGNLKLKHEVNWHEQDMGKPLPNALPYVIENKYPSINGVYNKPITELLLRSLELDGRLKNYLDLKYPLPLNPELNIAAKPLSVVSAFMAWVLMNRKSLLLGVSEWVPMAQVKTKLDAKFKEFQHDICLSNFDKRYLRILPYGFDENYAFNVTEKEYDFLEKVNQYYLKGRIQLNEYLTVGS